MKTLRILIVDDNEGLAEVIHYMLRFAGYDSRVARNPAEAYRAFLRYRPALVISDLCMQGENGVDLVRRMREAKNANFNTIYMSGDLGRFSKELAEERRKYQVNTLAKPFRKTELLRLVAEFERVLAMRTATPLNNERDERFHS